jgi:pimeloyl-ACP methyl ester carboxylesterase
MLVFPKSPQEQFPCIVMIHGDGPIDRDSNSGYDVFFEEFTRAGWCVMSWDKPGIGKSTGDWLDQSMSDRANEALAAVDYLQSRSDVIADRIGLLGYSQAGWVLPLAASRSDDVAFIIPVSAAIDVVRQSRYYRKNLWELKGYSQTQIDANLAYYDRLEQQSAEHPSYESYVQRYRDEAPESYGELMSKRRWVFSNKLGGVNAREALRRTHCPVLAIWADQDLYVDVDESYKIYSLELARAGNPDVTLKIFPNGNHSLMTAHSKQLVHKGPSSWWQMFKYITLGKDAFVDGYFDLLIDWLDKRK